MQPELEEFLEKLRATLDSFTKRMQPRPTAYTYPEAAAELNRSVTTVKKMVLKREMQTIRVGGRPMVPSAEVDRILAYGTQPTPARARPVRRPPPAGSVAAAVRERHRARR